MDKRELTAHIRDRALKLGFDAVGFARVEPLPDVFFRDWLLRGYHADMSYLARDPARRLDPARVLVGARSVVSTALLYRHPDSESVRDPDDFGRISRYAQGTDYHVVLQKKLEELAAHISRLIPDAQARICVDTAPVLEKAWAVKAGIGWQAKNTNVLARRLGSWFFLGEILTDLELEYDEPVRDHCGSCTRCIDACPTGALEPYVLDSRRCISYLTIELRGDIPWEYREGVGSWIFGCDICQEVCPWNRRSRCSTVAEFTPNPGSAETHLFRLTRMTPEEFAERYRRTAIKRTKWRGLLRNVAIALGNTRNPQVLPALEELLNRNDTMVRRHAAWALARLGTPEARALLGTRESIEEDEETRKVLEQLQNLSNAPTPPR